MEQIGGSSYTIYLYHPVFVAAALSSIGTRIPLPTGLLFVIAGTVGIVGPNAAGASGRPRSGRPAPARGQHGGTGAQEGLQRATWQTSNRRPEKTKTHG